MKKVNSSVLPIELENQERTIFILDSDIELLKKLGKEIVRNYPGYQVLACDNEVDFRDELINQRVSVFIIELHKSSAENGLDLIRSIRSNPLYNRTSLMVMATREVLEVHAHFLETMTVELIPKSIRLPFFMGILQSCINHENTVEIDTVELLRGDMLFKEGDLPDKIYITKKGELEVFQEKDEDEFLLGTIGENEVVGEMAFLKKESRTASVRARSECTVLAIDLSNIEHFIETQPFWLKMILDSLTKRMEEMNNRLKLLS